MTPLNVIDRHHLTSKRRLRQGAKRLPRNRIRLRRDKHNAWHLLFGHMTLDEIIATLERVRRFKCIEQSRKSSRGSSS